MTRKHLEATDFLEVPSSLAEMILGEMLPYLSLTRVPGDPSITFLHVDPKVIAENQGYVRVHRLDKGH
jgi:hypothetical protein